MTTQVFSALLVIFSLSVPAFAADESAVISPRLSCGSDQLLVCKGGNGLTCYCVDDPEANQPHPKPTCDAAAYECPPPGEGFHHG